MTSWLLSERNSLAVLLAVAASACAGPPADPVYIPSPPAYDNFPAVADALESHCGTLDCHGSSARNVRIYGLYGVRLSRANVTGKGGTTDEEYQATYSSIVAIQPEILSQVVFDHGARPERWIVITKGRGAENHKGGSRMKPGDDMDDCILSWLAGAVDTTHCAKATDVLPPGDAGTNF